MYTKFNENQMKIAVLRSDFRGELFRSYVIHIAQILVEYICNFTFKILICIQS